MILSELYSLLKTSLAAQFPDANERGIVSRRVAGHIAGVEPGDVMLRPDFRVEADKTAIDGIISRITHNEPIEYIFNSAQFLDLELCTNSNVLIPRPETEELAIMILDDLRSVNESRGGAGELSLLDIGTGSGCIPVYLSSKFPNCNYHACDISAQAIETARSNAGRYGCNINFINADILDWRNNAELDSLRLDVVVSNPPYVLESEKKLMQPNVLDYEPSGALFVDDCDPLIFYRAICDYANKHLNPGGRLYFEINERYGMETAVLMEEFGFEAVDIKNDLFGKDRFVFGRIK